MYVFHHLEFMVNLEKFTYFTFQLTGVRTDKPKAMIPLAAHSSQSSKKTDRLFVLLHVLVRIGAAAAVTGCLSCHFFMCSFLQLQTEPILVRIGLEMYLNRASLKYLY